MSFSVDFRIEDTQTDVQLSLFCFVFFFLKPELKLNNFDNFPNVLPRFVGHCNLTESKNRPKLLQHEARQNLEEPANYPDLFVTTTLLKKSPMVLQHGPRKHSRKMLSIFFRTPQFISRRARNGVIHQIWAKATLANIQPQYRAVGMAQMKVRII